MQLDINVAMLHYSEEGLSIRYQKSTPKQSRRISAAAILRLLSIECTLYLRTIVAPHH